MFSHFEFATKVGYLFSKSFSNGRGGKPRKATRWQGQDWTLKDHWIYATFREGWHLDSAIASTSGIAVFAELVDHFVGDTFRIPSKWNCKVAHVRWSFAQKAGDFCRVEIQRNPLSRDVAWASSSWFIGWLQTIAAILRQQEWFVSQFHGPFEKGSEAAWKWSTFAAGTEWLRQDHSVTRHRKWWIAGLAEVAQHIPGRPGA